jgi:hypothetical protein
MRASSFNSVAAAPTRTLLDPIDFCLRMVPRIWHHSPSRAANRMPQGMRRTSTRQANRQAAHRRADRVDPGGHSGVVQRLHSNGRIQASRNSEAAASRRAHRGAAGAHRCQADGRARLETAGEVLELRHRMSARRRIRSRQMSQIMFRRPDATLCQDPNLSERLIVTQGIILSLR